MISHSFLIATHICLFLITLSATSTVWASPLSAYRLAFIPRQTAQPYFPDTPKSCPICASGYPSISTCAQAAPALANFSSVIFNPGAFISEIKCSCTDTFQSVFPQCADCFEKTNQTAVLDTPDLPSLVGNIRQLCSFASSLLGNASNGDGETTPSQSGTAASATGTSASSAAPPSNLSSWTASFVIGSAVALIIVYASML